MVERAARAADFDMKIHPHMLRHSCGYKLANDGVDTRTIQSYLGHKSIQLREREYRMAEQLQGKIAIVTGASNGIGRGIAELFAAEGAKTVLVARRAELLGEVAAGIKAKGGEALPLPGDLTKEDEIIALFKKAVETFGRLDVLVNNAGIAAHKNTEDITLDYWNEALAINITAPFLCAREAIRIMKAQQPRAGASSTSAAFRPRPRGRIRCPTR